MGRNKGIRVFTVVVIAILTLFIASVSFAQRSALVFLTDFGLKDGAVCAMKGVAFGVDPDLKMYDVTHEIPSSTFGKAHTDLSRRRVIGHLALFSLASLIRALVPSENRSF